MTTPALRPAADPARPWAGFLLNQAASHIRALTAAALAPLGLTPPALRALATVAAEAPLTQVRLGQLTGMDRTTIVHLVDRFEALGYARRTPDPADRRTHALALTPAGAAALARAEALARAAEDEALAPLTPPEREQLVRLLAKLRQSTPCLMEPR